mgnify:CR=1 FL=1
MIFKVVCKKEVLQSIIDALLPINDEVKLEITSDSITTKVVDAANVIYSSIKVPSSAFDYYQADSGFMAVELDKIGDLIGVGSKDAMVTLELDDPNKRLNIVIDDMKYKIGLIDPSAIQKMRDLPQLTFASKVTLDGGKFSSIVAAARKVTDDHVQVISNDESFAIAARGNIDTFVTAIPATGLADASALYSIDYFVSLSKIISKAETFMIEFSQDYPMRITLAVKGLSIEYLMAPRTEAVE